MKSRVAEVIVVGAIFGFALWGVLAAFAWVVD